MVAINYNDSILATPLNKQFLGEKMSFAKFKIHISKKAVLARAYTDAQTDWKEEDKEIKIKSEHEREWTEKKLKKISNVSD